MNTQQREQTSWWAFFFSVNVRVYTNACGAKLEDKKKKKKQEKSKSGDKEREVKSTAAMKVGDWASRKCRDKLLLLLLLFFFDGENEERSEASKKKKVKKKKNVTRPFREKDEKKKRKTQQASISCTPATLPSNNMD